MTDDAPKFRRVRMTAFRVHADCACGGELISTGQGFMTNEMSWLHECDRCSEKAWLDQNYPAIEHKAA